jgi:hypothetical protein
MFGVTDHQGYKIIQGSFVMLLYVSFLALAFAAAATAP